MDASVSLGVTHRPSRFAAGICVFSVAAALLLVGVGVPLAAPADPPQQAHPAPSTGGALAGLPHHGAPPPATIVFWWQSDAVKHELGLSDDKAQRIASIYQKRQSLLAPMAAEY